MQICAVEGVNAREIEFNGRSAGVFYEDEYAEYAVLGGLSPRDRTAGRTDTGVHASHQVCHLDVNEDVLKRCVGHMDVPPVIALTRRLQRMLPADIAIRGIAPAPDGLDARFSAFTVPDPQTIWSS